MRIRHLEVRNFRLLKDVSLLLEERTTLIVGRNNSGKTSITELFRRLLSDKALSFKLEDFSLGCHEGFWVALEMQRNGESADKVRATLPTISIKINIAYDVNALDLGPLSDCIIDLNPDCKEAQIEVTYGPQDNSVPALFEGFETSATSAKLGKIAFFRAMSERVPSNYAVFVEAVDPNDPTNRKAVEMKTLGALIQGGFINAQRGLDDETRRERDVLGKVIEVLFQSALTDVTDPQRRTTAEELKEAVEQIQKDLHDKFNARLTTLLPTFDLFGYPGLSDPGLITETTFDVHKLLNDHTKVRYPGVNGLTLPETYNGLGARNLVYILLQLLRFFREFQARPSAAGVHLIFIEEPEAHLHPQMQEVFIRRIEEIVEIFATKLGAAKPWPVQFVVSTHSPHMANEARFECMRYFLTIPEEGEAGIRQTQIKDLRKGMGDAPEADREFLHQYLTLTRCDLFFADKAILIEGTAERVLLPKMIQKVDAEDAARPQLASQYLTIMEVGGAYAHRFFDLLSFLDLRALIITDIDSVKKSADGKYKACPVAAGERTSNGCIKEWFRPKLSSTDLLNKAPVAKAEEKEQEITLADLISKTVVSKIQGKLRLAYQVAEDKDGPCGRSFEDAFILANPDFFVLDEGDRAENAYALAADQKKSAFALEHAIYKTGWKVPRYIAEGLRWLAGGSALPAVVVDDRSLEIAAAAGGQQRVAPRGE